MQIQFSIYSLFSSCSFQILWYFVWACWTIRHREIWLQKLFRRPDYHHNLPISKFDEFRLRCRPRRNDICGVVQLHRLVLRREQHQPPRKRRELPSPCMLIVKSIQIMTGWLTFMLIVKYLSWAWASVNGRADCNSISRTRTADDKCKRTCGWLQSKDTIVIIIIRKNWIDLAKWPSKRVSASPSPPWMHICFWRGVKSSLSHKSADCCWLFGCLAIVPILVFGDFSLTFLAKDRVQAASPSRLSASAANGTGALILQ